ncbi:DUF1565 domain-containing protein, partial [Candidatus Poribacteria bacterium]|nr:DUF1565 domain-containing protein [Candidatus Poribacteria bacterium]
MSRSSIILMAILVILMIYCLDANAVAPLQLVKSQCYVGPQSQKLGGTIIVYFRIHNPNPFSVKIGLGCSIKPVEGEWIDDKPHDEEPSVPHGYSTQSRYFDIPSYISNGLYTVGYGIMDGGISGPYFDTHESNDLTVVSSSKTVYVDDSNSAGPWKGTSNNPFQYIQDGIYVAVDGDTVLVADGEYTGTGNVNLTFKGKAITVKSMNGAENCVIDCQGSENTRGFWFRDNEGTGSILDGFTIQNGNIEGTQPINYNGGGIRCDSSSPIIRNNIITNNSALHYGGGIYAYYSSSIIENNIIKENSTDVNGGGILLRKCSSLIIKNNMITKNSSHMAGGIDCDTSSLEINGNKIIENYAHASA